MKVIIPAAGRGTRLVPITDFSPKCLIDINGKPLLFYLLSELAALDVNDVTIVTGYRSHMVDNFLKQNGQFPNVSCIYNKDFETTNSIVSLSLTTHLWDQDFCIIDSDLLVKRQLLSRLVQTSGTCLIIDNSKAPDQIDMKAKVLDGQFVYMDKNLLRKDTFGEFFGLSRWNSDSGPAFRRIIEKCLSNGQNTIWYEFAIRELATEYILPVDTCSADMWIEIDSMADYAAAQKFAAEGDF